MSDKLKKEREEAVVQAQIEAVRLALFRAYCADPQDPDGAWGRVADLVFSWFKAQRTATLTAAAHVCYSHGRNHTSTVRAQPVAIKIRALEGERFDFTPELVAATKSVIRAFGPRIHAAASPANSEQVDA